MAVSFVDFGSGPGPALARDGHTTTILVDPGDHRAVLRAAGDLAADFGRVTGTPAALVDLPGADALAKASAWPGGLVPVVAGTLGHSALIDALAAAGRLSPELPGRWEAFHVELVTDPWPGVPQALVVAGADRRGTVYGLYELSSQLGVSPWHWWADVPVARRSTVLCRPGLLFEAPVVQYRGIFLNDEYPALTRWVAATYGTAPPSEDPPVPEGVALYGREFHARLFELLLRLRANLLWPAMWNNAFHEDDPDNGPLAEEYGIVLGTSHQEPLGRAQKEWDRRYKATLGHWNYGAHPEILERFWADGMERNRSYEQLYTIGLRGADDTEMAPGGPEANRRLLEHIVDRQREILADACDRPADQVPQVWALYKEVTEFYNAGMRVPDDVLLLWGEDNWGNLRRVPTAAERARSGGAGIYYHFDYHGGPRSYQWANTSPLAKIWDQMTLARQYGADRLWVVNVGHFKGYEHPLSYFLELAWNPDVPAPGDEFTRRWVRSLFGPTSLGADQGDDSATAHVVDHVAGVLADLARLYGRRKPELWGPDTYSLEFGEAEAVVDEWTDVVGRAEALATRLVPEAANAYFQLVLHPARSGACLAELYLAAGRNALWAAQGRAGAAAQADRVEALFARFQGLMDDYGRLCGGKWNHFQDQAVLGYVAWNDPPQNNLHHLKLLRPPVVPCTEAGIAWEGGGTPLGLDPLGRPSTWFEVFRKGSEPIDWAVEAGPGVRVEPGSGRVEGFQTRVAVTLDSTLTPPGDSLTRVVVRVAGQEFAFEVPLFVPELPKLPTGTFVETQGFLSLRADHGRVHQGRGRWDLVPRYGPHREGTGLRAWAPTDECFEGTTGARVDFPLWVCHPGNALVRIHASPALNVFAGRPLRLGVSLGGPVRELVLVPAGYVAGHDNPDWCRVVADEDRVVETAFRFEAGAQGLSLWVLDPGPVVTRVEVDLGGLPTTRLGPPESPRA